MSTDLNRLKERLLKFSKWNGECLESTYKPRTQSGYAIMKFGKSTRGAHRVSWMVHRGEIPEGMWVLHKCDNPICINPDHLFLGFPKDNTDDMVEKGRNNFRGMAEYSDEIVLRAIHLRKSGKTHKEISKILNLPMGTVNSFYRRKSIQSDVKEFYGVPKYSQEIRKKAIDLRKNGILCKEIQKILKIPKKSLTRIFNAHRKFIGINDCFVKNED